MKVGDLVKFSACSGWSPGIGGKIGIVVAIRQSQTHPTAVRREWDCLIDGMLIEGFTMRLDDPGSMERLGAEVICG